MNENDSEKEGEKREGDDNKKREAKRESERKHPGQGTALTKFQKKKIYMKEKKKMMMTMK